MHRCVRPVLTVLTGLLLLQCANRKWENIFDPGSPSYPQIEYFVFDGYESWEGWYFLTWRLKFTDVVQRTYPFVLELYIDGHLTDSYSFDMTPGYIGIYVGWDSWGPFASGTYKAALKYGGEVIYEDEYHVSSSALHRRPAADPGYLFDSHKIKGR